MTGEQERYIKEHWNTMSCEDLRKQFNVVFGTSFKTTAFHYHTKRIGLSKHIEHKYTPEQDDFLRECSGKMTRAELTDLFNKTFHTNIKEQAIIQRCYQRGWKPKTDGRFKHGSVPWEKTAGGREEYIQKLKGGNSHSFEKGHIPHNRKEVGSVVAWGHELKIKTENGWKTKRRYIWERKNGEIPKGHAVISIGGDPDENDVNKMRLVSNKTLTTLISNDWNDKDEVIVDTAILYAELMNMIKGGKNESI